MGSMTSSFTRSSKCTCGPVERPVEPSSPITWPRDAIANRGVCLQQVTVQSGDATAMSDDDVDAVADGGVAHRHHDPICGRHHRGPERSCDVDPGMEMPVGP